MPRAPSHLERHLIARIGWLRAAVLGANDGIVSTASLIVGVAAAGADKNAILISGTAALVAGAMSMAAGEYVSVSSQSDTENADLAREKKELETDIDAEREELTNIYVGRGLTRELAAQVADQMMAHDALGAHARDELAILEITKARPIQAAITSALTFAGGAALPMIVVLIAPLSWMVQSVSASALLFLALLGAMGARAGGADILKPIARVVFWGALALAVTAGIGAMFGAIV